MNKNIYKLTSKFNFIPYSLLQKLTGQNTILPFYHCISDNSPTHIKYLYKTKSVKDFESDLDFLLKYHEPIDFHSLTHNSKNNIANKKYFLLSFDDGLKEFYEIITPILLRKGVPAICFLNSNFIDNKELFFRFKASILIEELKGEKKYISKNKKKEIEAYLYNNGINNKNIIQAILSISYSKKHLLDFISKIIDVDFYDYLKNVQPYLNKLQIEELIKKGFHFGAHSKDHPLYSEIDIKEQIIQTKESLDYISNTFKLEYRLFSFPFNDYNVSKEFYNILFYKNNPITDFSFGTSGLKNDTIIKNFQRIPMEIEDFTAKKILYGEYYYYIIKSFFNKNIIKRK